MAKAKLLEAVKPKPSFKDDFSRRAGDMANHVRKNNPVRNFVDFIREQGVIGLSVGIVLGGAVTGLTKSLVNDIISPLLSLVLGRVQDLQDAVVTVSKVDVRWGAFVVQMIDFIIIASVVFFVVRGLGLDRLDKKKEK